MADDWERMYVLPLDGADVDPALAGGKGVTLSRLVDAGLPVPPAFLVTAGAYRHYLERGGLGDKILALLTHSTPEQAERAVAELFSEHELPTQIAGPIRWAYADLGDRYHAVAVRPSGSAEDVPDPSAERQDTYLDVRGDAELLEAVRRCWRSLWSARAIAHRYEHGLRHADAAVAVVVQNMVASDVSGLMYTSGPVDGAADQVVISASWGLGGAVVGERDDPDLLVLDKASGTILTQSVADKAERTSDAGEIEPVPPELRARPALPPDQAAELARLAVRIEELAGRPATVEWAWRDGPWILQVRPLTPAGQPELGPPATGDAHGDALGRDDGLDGDHLWTRAELGEAAPDVLTPLSWSLVERMLGAAMPGDGAFGSIGGRLYLNLGQAAAFTRQETLEQLYGRLPADVAVSRERPAASALPAAVRSVVERRKLPDFLASSPSRCAALRQRIEHARYPEELTRLWRDALRSLVTEAGHMLAAVPGGPAGVRAELAELVGPDDADAMLSGLRVPAGAAGTARAVLGEAELAAVGPVVGLARLAHGTLDRPAYLREWGHRGAHEFEVAMPRPAEDPGWIDRQLMALGEAGRDAAALRDLRRDENRAAWERFRVRYPAKVAATRRKVGRWARSAHLRDAARSEAARVFWVMRAFVLRAGEMTGYGSDLFFLDIEEVVDVLRGREEALAEVPARRRVNLRYRTLPVYPALVRGPFDPFAWATDPGRRTDYHGPGTPPRDDDTIIGMSGSAGTAEGRVRVLHSPEEGGALRPGEILVAPVANVGWTPLFPRAAALVTDVGAPLSHAAGAARELGLPAVVGTGDATMRLRTGDHVRVDGATGAVRLVRTVDRQPTTAG
ncbi:PEP/pyruvate-binding domain-containing protein [Actinomadura hibisca]|uniref:PEP/pyruvate-binding domain-containing protein n=1 Tax=Actinomadura hibisca TaxID=68565 RepID=UPI00083040AD|nr:PEP/pyruvate-binding domain-containing protein [Actinomadura hibisca]